MTSERGREPAAAADHDDLLKYGLIPEFVGRLPVTRGARSAEPGRAEADPGRAEERGGQAVPEVLRAGQRRTVFTDDALEATARQAEERKTGARGLRTTIEEVLLDVMYEIPSMESVRKCIVDENVIINRSRPLLMTETEKQIPYAESAHSNRGRLQSALPRVPMRTTARTPSSFSLVASHINAT